MVFKKILLEPEVETEKLPDSRLVCICGNVKAKQIKAAIEAVSTTLEKIQIDLGVACRCCSCVPEIKEILASYQKTS